MMSKQQKTEAKLRRQLAKAQARVQKAQDKRARVVLKGQQRVEVARQRAAASVAKATERVERRLTDAAHIEQRLKEVRSVGVPPSLAVPVPEAPRSPGIIGIDDANGRGASDPSGAIVRPDGLREVAPLNPDAAPETQEEGR